MMWVSYDNLWLFYAGSAALILAVYVLKALILCFVPKVSWASSLFTGVVVACIPITWALSPDWNNRAVYRIGIYVGSPVATLTVPCVSFIIDWSRRVAVSRRDWFWRVPLELFVAVPAWFCFWASFEAFFLGWVWI
jgi:hypothetical protein